MAVAPPSWRMHAARCWWSLHQRQRGTDYADRDEFVECLKLLVGDVRLRAALGRSGRDYVRRKLQVDVVLGKFDRIFAKVRNAR